ncbi:hypothetical protein JCM12296A_33760 [Desulfosarcina cetonica]|uniref:SUMF1/EgtB/PvdO family nonheme iron enzyme n=1 Tax=Desulfosarcina cetonica TaxID=90730 RepID=UPI0006D1FCE1|nr:SUMF1/EgtB/PvdO family nonheme iron enzyme [Desulfosarcina cetonica]
MTVINVLACRVLRGGSWINNGRNVRSANRNRNAPDERNDNIGLRLARAQRFAGWQMSDQIVILSRCMRLGKKQKDPGMSVGVDVEANVERLPGDPIQW